MTQGFKRLSRRDLEVSGAFPGITGAFQGIEEALRRVPGAFKRFQEASKGIPGDLRSVSIGFRGYRRSGGHKGFK